MYVRTLVYYHGNYNRYGEHNNTIGLYFIAANLLYITVLFGSLYILYYPWKKQETLIAASLLYFKNKKTCYYRFFTLRTAKHDIVPCLY